MKLESAPMGESSLGMSQILSECWQPYQSLFL
jgi:hypothetical protein